MMTATTSCVEDGSKQLRVEPKAVGRRGREGVEEKKIKVRERDQGRKMGGRDQELSGCRHTTSFSSSHPLRRTINNYEASTQVYCLYTSRNRGIKKVGSNVCCLGSHLFYNCHLYCTAWSLSGESPSEQCCGRV